MFSRRYKDGETIVSKGKKFHSIYFLSAGRLKVLAKDGTHCIMTLGPGAVFGDYQAILNLKSNYDYVAENDPNDNVDGGIIFLGVPIQYIEKLIDVYPQTKAHLQ